MKSLRFITLLFTLLPLRGPGGACTSVRAQGEIGDRSRSFADEARWIAPPGDGAAANSWWLWRWTFDLERPPERARLKIAVDSKYWLFVNDRLVVFEGGLRRGPTPTGTYYDVVDLSDYLRAGRNEVAVLHWYWGKEGYNHKNSGRAGLLVDLADGLVVSDGNWRVAPHPAFGTTGPPHPNYRLPEQNVRFDGRRAVGVWMEAADQVPLLEWATPQTICAPGAPPFGELWERPFPQWTDSGLIEYDSLRYLPTDTSLVVHAYLPANITITPALALTPGTGGQVPARWAGRSVDMRTDNYKGGSEYNVRSEYILRAGEQSFETPGYQNGHYVIYTLPWTREEADAAGVTFRPRYRETRFPTNFTGTFRSDDEALNTLWEKARTTLNINLRDAIQDPDRERSQWWGDAVIIMGELFYATDTTSHALIRKAMSNLVEWQKADGTLFSPAPAGSWDKELPNQMLASVGEYGFWNYFRYTADTVTLRYLYPHVRDYLDLWTTGPEGLVIERPGGWTWVDWGSHYDKAALYNFWYGQALRAALRMARVLVLANRNPTQLQLGLLPSGVIKKYSLSYG